MHYKPEKATLIINACVVLHNICITFNIPENDCNFDEVDLGIHDDEDAINNEQNSDRHYIQGQRQRNKIIGYLSNRNI